MNRFLSHLLVGATLVCATPLVAAEPEPVQQHNSNAVWFENWNGLSNATMTISTPNGKVSSISADSGTPVFQLSGRDVVDGIYRYELKAATEEKVEIVNPVDNGRGEKAENSMLKPFYMSGYFTVARGVIITPDEIKEDDG